MWTYFERTPLPMSTYLFSIVLSNHVPSETMKFKSDFNNNPHPKKFRIWGPSNLISKGRHHDSLILGTSVMKQFTKLFRIGYVFPKMDLISITNLAVPAVENMGLVSFKERFLFSFANKSNDERLLGLSTIIHELSHQWFGNLVTPRWWEHLWLSEGMATFIELILINKVDVPGVKHWDLEGRFIASRLQGALEVDSIPSNEPLSQNVWRPNELMSKFNETTYLKGSSILRMFMHDMGYSVLIKSLRKYLKRHALKSATPDDLMAVFDEEIIKVKGKANWTQKYSDWYLKSGYPVLLVHRHKDTLNITSERFIMRDKRPITNNGSEWFIPISYSTSKEVMYQQTKPFKYLKKGEKFTQITFKIPKSKWYTLNNQVTGFYRVAYDPENWIALKRALFHSKERKKIHVFNRAQILDDIFNLALVQHTNYANYTTAMSIASYLPFETNYLPWRSYSNVIFILLQLARSDEELSKYLKKFTNDLLREQRKHISNSNNKFIDLLLKDELKALKKIIETGQAREKIIGKDSKRMLSFYNQVPYEKQKMYKERSDIIDFIKTFLNQF